MSYASYEIGKLESRVRELEEEVTVTKADRDEYKRQRDEALGDLSEALTMAQPPALWTDSAKRKAARVTELKRKHHL